MTDHRMAVNPLNGGLWVAERFAVDYVQLQPDARMLVGDPTKLSSYPYYGAAIHAVSDGPVVAVVDGLPDQVPGKNPTGLTLDQYGGNYIVQDIGGGNYAFYAHLKPGSVRVKVGEALTSGQTIAELGNSGNSSAPHLHFHVMSTPTHCCPMDFRSYSTDSGWSIEWHRPPTSIPCWPASLRCCSLVSNPLNKPPSAHWYWM